MLSYKTITQCAVIHSAASQRYGTPIAFSPSHWHPGSKTVEGSRGASRVVARASVAAGVSVLWLFIGAVGAKGLCGESNIRAEAFVAPTEKGRKIAQPKAMRDECSLVPPVVVPTLH